MENSSHSRLDIFKIEFHSDLFHFIPLKNMKLHVEVSKTGSWEKSFGELEKFYKEKTVAWEL